MTYLIRLYGRYRNGYSDYSSVVDDEDSDLDDFCWMPRKCGGKTYSLKIYASRYPSVNGITTAIHLHRVILGRKLGRELLSTEFVDHRRGSGLDNRRTNLRLATPAQNRQNTSVSIRNTSGITGVSWDKPCSKWRAEIRCADKKYYLGVFAAIEDAVAARRAAELEYYGEFSPTLSREETP